MESESKNRPSKLAVKLKHSKVPVNPSLAPDQNAPAWVATLAGLLAGLIATWAGVDDAGTVTAITTVLGLVLGVAAQNFTAPVADTKDHG